MKTTHDSPILNWKEEYTAKAIKAEKYMKEGGGISCGHSKSFWEHTKECHHGSIIFCERCGQFLVKGIGLPWLTEHTYLNWDNDVHQGTNHLNGDFFYPIRARLTWN